MIVTGAINDANDVRAFYAISDHMGFEPIFIPFPGYKNLNQRGDIIQRDKSDGQSDQFIEKDNDYGFVPQNLHFKEYTFTEDDLPSFKSYRIKIIMTSTSQVYVPRLKDLRAIALA